MLTLTENNDTFYLLLLAFFRQTLSSTIDKFDVYQGITMTALPRKNMW